jgi:hypothetical protein
MRQAVIGLFFLAGLATADDAVRIEEQFPVGKRYTVRTRVELSGTLVPPASKGKESKPVKVQGTSAIDYEERVLAVSARGEVMRTLRQCQRVDFRRTTAGREQEQGLRPTVRRLVVWRKGHTESAFSPDGPLLWGELDVVRTDVFIPALAGLFPEKAVSVNDTWKATTAAVKELTDLEKVEEGGIECKLEKIVRVGTRRLARVRFTGTVKGVGEDGTVRHKVQGTFHHDLAGKYLADLVLNGIMSMLDADGKEAGRVEGRFVMIRSPGSKEDGLSDEAVRKLKTTVPNDENTRILYDNADVGVKFLYPRSWAISREGDNQVEMAGPGGDGLLLTLDGPGKTPTVKQLRTEAQQWVTKQKGKVLRYQDAVVLRRSPMVEWFSVEAKVSEQTFWMDYYTARQDKGGATVAARLRADGITRSRTEVAGIVKTLLVSPPRKTTSSKP